MLGVFASLIRAKVDVRGDAGSLYCHASSLHPQHIQRVGSSRHFSVWVFFFTLAGEEPSAIIETSLLFANNS
jgi:hypothetical protein